MKCFQLKPHHKNLESTIKNPMILCFRSINEVCSRFHGNRQTDWQTDTDTHTQTDTQNDYRNPCTCALRVKNKSFWKRMTVRMYLKVTIFGRHILMFDIFADWQNYVLLANISCMYYWTLESVNPLPYLHTNCVLVKCALDQNHRKMYLQSHPKVCIQHYNYILL